MSVLGDGNVVRDQKTTGTSAPERWDKVAELLGVKAKTFSGGVENCEFSVRQLSDTLDLGLVKPEQKYNYSPNVETFFEFGKRAETHGATVEYIGFLESKYRDDARLLVDGIRVTNFSGAVDLILDFAQTFHTADEFTANSEMLRAWYD